MLNSRISLLALMLSLGAPLAAVAQETAPATDAPAPTAAETPAESAAPAADSNSPALAMGQEVSGENPIYVEANFEAWEQRCEKSSLGADPCQLYQLLKDDEGNSVAELAMFNLPAGSNGPAVAGANFIAPLETLLTAGLQLTVDAGKPRGYPFSVCTPIGCVAQIGFTAEEIAAFKKGAKATFSITPFIAPDQKVNLEVSLKGFTAGYDAMIAANEKADEAVRAAAAAKPAEATAPAQ